MHKTLMVIGATLALMFGSGAAAMAATTSPTPGGGDVNCGPTSVVCENQLVGVGLTADLGGFHFGSTP